MAGLIVRPRSRLLHGHDWVYATEVLKVFGHPEDGQVISLKDSRDRFLGSAIYNSKSHIVARRFSFRRQHLDQDFFQRRVHRAIELRRQLGLSETLGRLVWSESDGLPGLIVDRYNTVLVMQTLTLAMDQNKAVIADILAALPGVECVIERNDAASRVNEGLPQLSSVLVGALPDPFTLEINGMVFQPDLLGGQKTGLYLDQIGSYALVSKYAANRRVLDCFSNQGGFALFCHQAGASEVTAVEAGATSAAKIRKNAAANGCAIQVVEGDVFDFLRKAETRRAEYDLIVLDPPSFTKSRGKVQDALRGYRELHLRAAPLLAKDGILASFSCSHNISWANFEQSVAEGFADAKRSVRVLERIMQPLDHPILLHLPETEYLKGLVVQLVPGR